MKFRWTPRVWSQGSADSGDLLSYPSLPELESFYRELQNDFAGSVALEIAGHSVRGLPIWLLTITDQGVSDEDKQRVLMVGQEHGQERSASLALLELARWLVTPAAAEIRRRQCVGLMPVVNPDSWEDLRFNNVNDVNLYADFSLDDEPTQPESQAVADILARMQPELFCSLHGTEFGWKYRMGESNGFSWTTSQFDRSHSRLFIEEINRAAESAGFPQDRGEEEAERILPWLPGNIHHSYYSGQRITSCVHAYHRYHTLGNTMEVHHPLSGLIRCVTMLELGNQPWRTEAVAGYPVRTMFQQDETFVAAYGQTAAERRASRVELWAHSNQFLVARGVNEPVGMALTAFSMDPDDFDRWRTVEIDPFLQQYGHEQGIDVTEVRAACRRYPRLQSLRCDQIKPAANEAGRPLLRAASQGLALRLRLPRLAAPQRIWLDGRPIGASPVDGYESWNTRNGFTMVQFNISPRANSDRFQRHLIAVAYRAQRTDRGELA